MISAFSAALSPLAEMIAPAQKPAVSIVRRRLHGAARALRARTTSRRSRLVSGARQPEECHRDGSDLANQVHRQPRRYRRRTAKQPLTIRRMVIAAVCLAAGAQA